MGTRVPTINVLSKNKKNIIFFPLKIFIFLTQKKICILHGCVFVMENKGTVHDLRFWFRICQLLEFRCGGTFACTHLLYQVDNRSICTHCLPYKLQWEGNCLADMLALQNQWSETELLKI